TNATTRNIHLAHGFSDSGTYGTKETANDNGSRPQSKSKTLTTTVNNVNQQPAITAPGTASGTEGTAITPITATATDADGAANNRSEERRVGPACRSLSAQVDGT